VSDKTGQKGKEIAQLIGLGTYANFSTIDSPSGSKKKDYVQKLNAEAKVKTETICKEIVEAIVTIVSKKTVYHVKFKF
jgi:hypothetical protein